MSLSPFHSQSLLNASLDPHWNMELPGADLMGFHNHLLGSRHGFPNVPAPELGLDLTEESDKWVIHADMPGFKDEDVELSVDNGMLSVTGTRDKTVKSDTAVSHRVEVCCSFVHNTYMYFCHESL
jgi:HSP20 family molecular chaperone IbpA